MGRISMARLLAVGAVVLAALQVEAIKKRQPENPGQNVEASHRRSKSNQLMPALVKQANDHVKAWFDVVESELTKVMYNNTPTCAPESLAYINVVVHIFNKTWKTICGDLTENSKAARGPPLIEILDAIVPNLNRDIDVYLPFGMHDGVANVRETINQHLPVFGPVYHPVYSTINVPFAMGVRRSSLPYVNTPVVGWDEHVNNYLTCSNTQATVRKAAFRGKAAHRAGKYGACTFACTWKDNGRLFTHSLGLMRPDIFDTAATNAVDFGFAVTPSQGFLPFPDQLCNFYAVLNIGSNVDWAERLRSSFFGNAIVVVPENPPKEYFTAFMTPYLNYWPTSPDLSDIQAQVETIMRLHNRTEVLDGQKAFARSYLSEKFMLYFDKKLIEEYAMRVKKFKEGTWKAATRERLAGARELLKIHGCISTPQVRRCQHSAGLWSRLKEA